MAFKVKMTWYIPGAPIDDSLLTRAGIEFERRLCSIKDEAELIQEARDADSVIVLGMQAYTRRVLESLPRCRHICVIGIGYDGVDVPAATERGILVSNNPFYCLEEVSDHALALLLAWARKLFPLGQAVKEKKWDSVESPTIRKIATPMFRLRGRTLGVVGFGRIPRTLAPKAQGFGLKVLAYDPYVPAPEATALGVDLVPLDRLLEEADFISVHAALTPQNRKLFGAAQFRKMKPTAYFINTARGGLVDEAALARALEEGWIAGAALDVTDPEPLDQNSPLAKAPNLIITPHHAWYSVESEEHLWRWPLEEVLLVAKGNLPRGLVNPQAKDSYRQRWGA